MLRTGLTDRLRDLIVGGELAPGARLVERTVADRYGVSRVPVREALATLLSEGFLEQRPTRGLVVRHPDDDELDQLLEVREGLETALCVRLATAGDAARLEGLDATLAAAEGALSRSDDAAAVAANADFHRALVDADPDGLAAGLLRPLSARLGWLLRQHADPRPLHDEHVLIRAALGARDVALVRRLVRRHVRTSRAALATVRGSRGG